MHRLLVLCVVGVVLLSARAATAAVVSSFVFDQADYLVAPGATVNVNVYWQQAVTGGESSVLAPSSGIGMYAQGVQVRWDDPMAPSQPAKVANADDIVDNSAFNDTGSMHRIASDSYAQLSEVTDSLTFAYGSQMSTGVWQQWIGTFSFTAGAVSGEVTHLLATRYVGPVQGGSYIVDANGNAYDGETAVATATITTIPEPSGLVLGGIAALAIFGFCWWAGRTKHISNRWGLLDSTIGNALPYGVVHLLLISLSNRRARDIQAFPPNT